MKKNVFTKWMIIITILIPLMGSANASNPNTSLFSQDGTNFSFGPKASFHFDYSAQTEPLIPRQTEPLVLREKE